MRTLFVLLLATLLLPTPRVNAERACTNRALTVTAQLHDYVNVPNDSLLRARELVAAVYKKIGVSIEWLPTIRHGNRRSPPQGDDVKPSDRIAQLTMIIVTGDMAGRGRIPDGVLGYAAVPEDGGMGRIGYVIYHRVRQIAHDAHRDESELLAFVLTHETGHLLLGRGVRATAGLMRCHWEQRDVQQMDARKLEFLQPHAERIRHALENRPAADDACVTASSVDPVEHLR